MLHHLKIIIFTSLILLMILPPFLRANQRDKIKIRNYEFVYNKPDSLFVNTLVSRVASSLKKIEDFFGYQTGSVVTIFITRSEAEYLAYAQRGVPEWSQAVAFPDKKIIILKIINPGDVGKSPEIVLHEIVHIFFGERYLDKAIPVWLNEGIAEYLSGYKMSFEDKILVSNALAANNLPELGALDSLLEFSQHKAKLGYLLAFSAVEYIVIKHGEEGLKQLVKNLSKTRSVNQAFKVSFGYDFIDFEIYWFGELKQDYRWLVLLNLENLIWVTIGILALIAILRMRLMNKKKLQEWDQTEGEIY